MPFARGEEECVLNFRGPLPNIQCRPMKKSRTVTLILLTSSLFLGCQDKMRNEYGSWDDCVKDYRDPSKCEASTTQGSGGYFHTSYFGPWYSRSNASSYAHNPSSVTGRAIGVSRGGFGGSGGHGGHGGHASS